MTEEDLEELLNPADTHINPRGVGGTILDQIQGRVATRYISASLTEAGAAIYLGGAGMIEFDSDQVIAAGSGIVDHANVLQVAQRQGNVRDVANVTAAQEVLITRGIPKSAIVLVMP